MDGGSHVQQYLVLPAVDLFRFFTSKRCLSTVKSTLTILIAFILVLSTKFDTLQTYPQAFSFMPISTIVTFSGKNVGACITEITLTLLGVACGSVGFYILARMDSAVGQGVVFFLFTYAFALFKARGFFWFSYALIAILVTLQGIYSRALFGQYEAAYLHDIFKTFCWGSAVGLTVNLLVFPVTAEKELRRTLASSLHHVAVFSHLLAKSYALEISDAERQTRDSLAGSITADFNFVPQKITELTAEINHSRFSMDDYLSFVGRTRAIQQSLLSIHSSLKIFESSDVELFKNKFLPATRDSFMKLRASIQLTIRDVITEIGADPSEFDTSQAGYTEFLEVPMARSSTETIVEPQPAILPSHRHSRAFHANTGHGRHRQSVYTFDQRIESITRRMNEEIASEARGAERFMNSALSPANAGPHPDLPLKKMASFNSADMEDPPFSPISMFEMDKEAFPSRPGFIPAPRSALLLRQNLTIFAERQHSILTDALISGILPPGEQKLALSNPMPSLQEKYGLPNASQRSIMTHSTPEINQAKYISSKDIEASWELDAVSPSSPTATEIGYFPPVRSLKSKSSAPPSIMSLVSEPGKETPLDHHPSLMRVYSFLFAMEQLVIELEALYTCASNAPRQPRMRLRVAERFGGHVGKSFSEVHLHLQEAVSVLRGNLYTHPHVSFAQRYEKFESWLRAPDSIFAAKSAAAATVFVSVLLIDRSRAFFLDYNLTGGAITIIAAMSPTLGQTLISWVLQIVGSGGGYIWAFLLLEMFKNIGGYAYNPYLIVIFSVPYTLCLNWIFHERPKFFIASLLGLNSAGVTLVNQWVQIKVIGNTHWGGPSRRLPRSLTSLSIAIGIAVVFQLFILRNPARRVLRKSLRDLVYGQLAHSALLQAFVEAAIPEIPSMRPHETALVRVEKELRRREQLSQAAIIQLGPLMRWASLEPESARKFPAKTLGKLIRANQIILDGLREARQAVGIAPLPDVVLREFTSVLAPYHLATARRMQSSLYLSGQSLASKSPMPREFDTALQTDSLFHDALVLTKRLGQTRDGEAAIRKGEFTRYFHYLMILQALKDHLSNMESACRELFGELEDRLL